jgi:hypothetical protein
MGDACRLLPMGQTTVGYKDETRDPENKRITILLETSVRWKNFTMTKCEYNMMVEVDLTVTVQCGV